MRLSLFAVAVLLLAAAPHAPARADSRPGSPASLYAVGSNGDYAIVEAGSTAPDFSYDAAGGTYHLRDLRGQGHVLLVIAPDDARLAALEAERPRLLALGVVPVAALDSRAGACRSTVGRLGLGYTVIADSRRLIGAQFNALDPSSRGDVPAWFVIDRNGRVRDLARQAWPAGAWTSVCSRALGLPEADAPAPASYRR